MLCWIIIYSAAVNSLSMCPKDSRNNGKRWGDEFIDKRNWKSYNEELVIRGELLLPIMFGNWDGLDGVRARKAGHMDSLDRPLKSIMASAGWLRGWGMARSLERCLMP